ncbi:MAG: ABC transporter ATP-binding protein [Actinobacteria bacterium]|nr:ABC transporter ATP-binding protein [Actinomycetota bacterium]
MPLLQVEGASVRFGGLLAVSEADLDASAGEITGLIGPNGAGKTTLFNVICGLQEAVAGRVTLDGDDISRLRPHERARRGIARTFQRFELFGTLTTRENVLVAAEIRRRWSKDAVDPPKVVAEVLRIVGLDQVAEDRVDSLPTGLARLVEIARSLAMAPRLLLLDEASSGLSEEEKERVAEVLRDLTEREGLGVLLVEHDIDLVMGICSRIHVLDFGRMIANGTPEEVQADPAVQAAYLGTDERAEAAS